MDEKKLHPQITLEVVLFALYEQRLCLLLIKRESAPFLDAWSLPLGEIDLVQDQCLEDSAKRKLKTLLGVDIPYLEQVQTVGNENRDPRGWSVSIAYYGLLSCDEITNFPERQSRSKRGEARWVPIDEAMKNPLAFDHQRIIENCLQRFQNKSLYTSLPIFLLPTEFTLTELQKCYEAILGFKIEKKSFRRRLLDAGFLQETGNIRRASHRPALLYRLAHQQPYFFPRIIEGVRDSRHPV
ncbi:MAG: NUDIX domain-containing protein [Candidatus Berkiellales bacterium]